MIDTSPAQPLVPVPHLPTVGPATAPSRRARHRVLWVALAVLAWAAVVSVVFLTSPA